MKPSQRLAEVFDRGYMDDGKSLSPADRELFLIQDFIIEYEMGGLTTYFYNRILEYKTILATVKAMKKHGLPDLASLLGEAADLFRGYKDDPSLPTWKDILRHYDPKNRLAKLHRRIEKLDNYGLSGSSIT
jgi:hypothetical protein